MNKNEINTSMLRQFGFIMGFFIALLFGMLFPWILGYPYPFWPWILAGIFLATALLSPDLLGPVYKWWMRVGLVIGWINSRVIMILLFYLVMFPMGLILKLLGKDPLNQAFERNKMSYRVQGDLQIIHESACWS